MASSFVSEVYDGGGGLKANVLIILFAWFAFDWGFLSDECAEAANIL